MTAAKCSCIFMFGEAIDCAWSGNSDFEVDEIACLGEDDHFTRSVDDADENEPSSDPEIFSTNDGEIAISVSKEEAQDLYDPALSTDLSHDIEFTMNMESSTPQACRLPSSKTGKE